MKLSNERMVFSYWTFDYIKYLGAIFCSNRCSFHRFRLNSSTPVACQWVTDHACLNRFKQRVADGSFNFSWLHGSSVLDVSFIGNRSTDHGNKEVCKMKFCISKIHNLIWSPLAIYGAKIARWILEGELDNLPESPHQDKLRFHWVSSTRLNNITI